MGSSVTIQANQNILDVCLQAYGTMEYLWDVHADNRLAAFPANLPTGYVLAVFPEKKQIFNTCNQKPKIKNQKSKVEIQASQNVLDICLQEYGSMEYLWDIHADNGLEAFPANLPADYALTVYPEKIKDSKRAVAILQLYHPGTGSEDGDDALFHDGYFCSGDYFYTDRYYLTP